ncbi:MAG: hypothetical protein F6K28_12750 [Microcoleus sp. SIO2G3]|nr:hypothetical protein [Microcoleus sp. SIO2G3]
MTTGVGKLVMVVGNCQGITGQSQSAVHPHQFFYLNEERCPGQEFDNDLYTMLKSSYVVSVTRRLG